MYTHLPVDIKAVLHLLDRVDHALYDSFTPKELQELGDWALWTIQRRTRKGKDVDGKDFTPYNDATKADRAARGRTTSRVTLEDTGKMMSNMTAGVEGDKAVVFFSSANEGRKAHFINEGTKNMPRRQFMKLSRRELAQANEIAAHIIVRRLG